MDKTEARSVLKQKLNEFATRPYSDLVALIDKPVDVTVTGTSGTSYGIEFNMFYDSHLTGDLRIIGSIDDGGWRAWFPLTETLIMKSNGKFV